MILMLDLPADRDVIRDFLPPSDVLLLPDVEVTQVRKIPPPRKVLSLQLFRNLYDFIVFHARTEAA